MFHPGIPRCDIAVRMCSLATVQSPLPGIAFVSSFLLVAGELYQIGRVEPPDKARFESYFRFRPQLVPITRAKASGSMRPHTTGQKRRPPVSSRR
jgi:hypothetical protein